MIIDPDGLFNGDRLNRCSNLARLYFPYLLLMSNGFGRIEVNYQRIVDRAFANFDPQPSQAEIEKVILEYHSQHLLFLYEGSDGQLWGQWDVRPALLKKHKSAADLRSPSPPSDDFQKWQEEYRKSKQQSNAGISDGFRQILGLLPKSEQISENRPKSPEVVDDFPLGVGVGVGVGVGDGKSMCVGTTDPETRILNLVQAHPKGKKFDSFEEIPLVVQQAAIDAIGREAKHQNISEHDAYLYLLRLTKLYDNYVNQWPKPEQGKCYRLEAWFNQKGYRDEPETWDRSEKKHDTGKLTRQQATAAKFESTDGLSILD